MERKSFWDVLDSILPTATSIYGRIRQRETGVDPFAQEDDTSQISPYTNMQLTVTDTKKGNNTLILIGGLLLVSAGAYFIIKKYKKK